MLRRVLNRLMKSESLEHSYTNIITVIPKSMKIPAKNKLQHPSWLVNKVVDYKMVDFKAMYGISVLILRSLLPFYSRRFIGRNRGNATD
jgi:hypothetical protein